MCKVLNLDEYRLAKNTKESICPICGSELIVRENKSCSCTKCLFCYDSYVSFSELIGLNEFDLTAISCHLKTNPSVNIASADSLWKTAVDCYSEGKEYLGNLFISYLDFLYKVCED